MFLLKGKQLLLTLNERGADGAPLAREESCPPRLSQVRAARAIGRALAPPRADKGKGIQLYQETYEEREEREEAARAIALVKQMEEAEREKVRKAAERLGGAGPSMNPIIKDLTIPAPEAAVEDENIKVEARGEEGSFEPPRSLKQMMDSFEAVLTREEIGNEEEISEAGAFIPLTDFEVGQSVDGDAFFKGLMSSKSGDETAPFVERGEGSNSEQSVHNLGVNIADLDSNAEAPQVEEVEGDPGQNLEV